MPRSLKKPPYVEHSLLKKIQQANETQGTKPIVTYSRRSIITPEFVGQTLHIHNGLNHKKKLFVTELCVGRRVGEFAGTRTFRGHAKGKKK